MKAWRVGRKVGRTIYEQQGSAPADRDPLIGVMDSRDLARAAVEAQNHYAALRRELAALVILMEDPKRFDDPSVHWADRLTAILEKYPAP